MHKVLKKILCFTVATVATLGAVSLGACDNYRSAALDGYTSTADKAVSNGGFAVEKGDYVYFINGREENTADNTYGNVVKGAIMRISKDDLAAHNYSSVDTVVPQIAYSGNNNSGIYVYGDYVYYATPSTEVNSDGAVQNSHLAFKRTKLDGTESMRGYFAQYSDNAVEYRYVEDNGTVYLIYVATNENLYGTSHTNIHAVNCETGEHTLLAYNVGSVMFDKDVTNPRIYYTMSVTDFVLNSTSRYNQIWTVTPDGATPNEYNFDGVENYDAEEDPLYVNCGTLVFDGIGKVEGMTSSVTQFNSSEEGIEDALDRSAYTYTLSSYQNGTLFYTRTSTQNDSVMLFAANESEILENGWKPVADNPEFNECLMNSNGGDASSYTYLFDGDELESVIIANASGLIKANIVTEDGVDKIPSENDIAQLNVNRYFITLDGQATVLGLDESNNYIYYSLSGGNGYTINRVAYNGGYGDYNGLPVEDVKNDYKPVRVLDLDAASDWYRPEFLEGQVLFLTETTNMTEYDYIMACDLRGENGTLSNSEIGELNDLYSEISVKIGEIDAEVYVNLSGALRYVFYTDSPENVSDLIDAFADIKNYDSAANGDRYNLSENSLELLDDFDKAEGDWEEYDKVRKINGVEVKANKLCYYYSVLGKMNDADAEAYAQTLVNNYLKQLPEEEQTWFESLSTGAKAGFIIGVCAGGLIIIAAAITVPLLIIRKRKKKLPIYKKRIKVDTTDDKDIDVYADENAQQTNDGGQTE